MKWFIAVGLALAVTASGAPAMSQPVQRATTQFDTKQCKHTRGRDVEDYGTWRCPGYLGVDVWIGAGDQRMQVSFGRNAANEPAAAQTFPAFNNVYAGTIEWRIAAMPDGSPRAFAAILRWNVRLESDARVSTGRVLVVTRLGPGGVCHVGYVDARANADANELARRLADEHARAFKCGSDRPKAAGKVSPGLALPE
jgi:hypothetical protein